MIELITINDKKVSIDKGDLELNLDLWGEAKWVFSEQFAMEMLLLWKVYQEKPNGVPVRSRHEVGIGIGADIKVPTVIHASFLCQEDMDDFETRILKALEKDETFVDLVDLKQKAEEHESKMKAQREEEEKQRTKALEK